MSSRDGSFLALHLEAPLQSWGLQSQFKRRDTRLLPTKSAIAGMCCAALGLHRGSSEEGIFLKTFSSLKMETFSIEKASGSNSPLLVRRLSDYQTVLGTLKASGSLNSNAVLTHRQYLLDAAFGVILKGDATWISRIEDGLKDPKWGIWLGRKTCIPSRPVLVGAFLSHHEALTALLKEDAYQAYLLEEDAESFADGVDTLPDSAVSFSTENRVFAPRRVRSNKPKAGPVG